MDGPEFLRWIQTSNCSVVRQILTILTKENLEIAISYLSAAQWQNTLKISKKSLSPRKETKLAPVVELKDGADDEIVTTEPSESVVVLSVVVQVHPEASESVVVHSLTVRPSIVVHHSVTVSTEPYELVKLSVHAVTD